MPTLRPQTVLAALLITPITAMASSSESGHQAVDDSVIADQRRALAAATDGKGFGPQSPRDIDALAGSNALGFVAAPAYQEMELCNIHFHKNLNNVPSKLFYEENMLMDQNNRSSAFH